MTAVLLDTYDLAVAEDVLSRTFAPVQMTARDRDKPTRSYIRYSAIDTTAIIAEHLAYSFDYTMDPPERLMLTRIHTGTMALRTAGTTGTQWFGPNQTAVSGATAGEPLSGSLDQCRVDVFLVDRGLLGTVDDAAPPDGSPVFLTGSAPVSEAADRQLAAALDYLRAAVVGSPEVMRNPLIAGAAQRYLAASMLAAYPNTAASAGSGPVPADRHDDAPALLRRAVAFIDENAHRDVSLADIAAVVHITPRALQYIFRKHRDCTPMEYLRRVRLHHAHLDLAAADPAATTVGQVAHRWGFGHLGRFAVHYRKLYGHSPHVTLHG